jgi:hypothetical protein
MTPARKSALETFQGRTLLPTHLNAEDISSQLSREVRERSFFMAKVRDVEILQKFHDETEKVLNQVYDETTAEKEIFRWLTERGYQAPAGKEGGLEDLSSLERINVVLRTNIDMARGYALWLQRMQVRDLFPAQRLVRKAERVEPRDWEARWADAYAQTAETPGAHPTEMIALIDHPIWIQLSRFSNPYPPFDFNSGMGVDPVKGDEAQRLGLLPEPGKEPPKPQPLIPSQERLEPSAPLPSFNESMESAPAITLPEYRGQAADELGNLAQWEGDKLVMTDPNGTRPMTAKALLDIWEAKAPKGFEDIPQRVALEHWKGGVDEVKPLDAFHLLRLFGRIESSPQAVTLIRSFIIPEALLASYRKMAKGKMVSIPDNIPGWEFGRAEQAVKGAGWVVTLKIKDATKAIDIRDLRPGSGGFVYVGGARFKVESFAEDSANRRILLTVEEA